MCVGCGICTTKCKFDAIHLEKVYDADNQEYFHTLGRIVKNVPQIGVIQGLQLPGLPPVLC